MPGATALTTIAITAQALAMELPGAPPERSSVAATESLGSPLATADQVRSARCDGSLVPAADAERERGVRASKVEGGRDLPSVVVRPKPEYVPLEETNNFLCDLISAKIVACQILHKYLILLSTKNGKFYHQNSCCRHVVSVATVIHGDLLN